MNIKNLLLVIAIILVVIGACVFLMAHQAHPKQDSKIIMTSNDNLTEGDNFTVKLTDLNNTPISNQNLNITIVNGKGQSIQLTLMTDSNGEVSFELNKTVTGNCAVKVKYGGNDEFNGCNFTENLHINEKIIPIKTNSTMILNRTNTTHNQIETVSDRGYYYPSGSGDDVITVEDY